MKKKKQSKKSFGIMAMGIAFVLYGVLMQEPSDSLTSYKILANDGSYSYVEEYVGGDAYNYIIAASLVGGKIAGVKTQKAIYVSAGFLMMSLGSALSWLENQKQEPKKLKNQDGEEK